VGRLIDAACATSAERIEPPKLRGSAAGQIQVTPFTEQFAASHPCVVLTALRCSQKLGS
jgi:hypothetical protein